MLKVGLTGGLACGKTFVAHELRRLGCHVIHADDLGHEVLASSGEAYGPVVELFGTEILDGSGEIDRARVASIVFHDPAKLAALNAIVHPAVRRRKDEIFAAIAAVEPDAIAVMEAAILIETGIYRDYDKLVVVYCRPALQIERALHRDPLTTEEAVRARLARQMPIDEKRRFADFLIDSSGPKENTLRQTSDVYHALRKLLNASCKNRGV
ncbi:dephospho-CoA kinase [Nevskia soli]|jgi:dephospho-CoA kinase|uniref:dephospho-CoA kinase n=1 Tax=Nevskia soli TaxID=418856 RepID=UPI0015D77832|nr:dephospho-CoA kinase [Nevskia soli]